MKVSHATMGALRASRMFIRNNVERFLQASREEKDAVLKTMEAIDGKELRFEVSGSLLLHPFLRTCNLDIERFVEALTQTPLGRDFDAGVVELAGVADALKRGRAKLDRLNAEIQQKNAEIRVLTKTIAELRPQVIENSVEVNINTILEVDVDVAELVAEFSTATEEMLVHALHNSNNERTRGALTFIGRELMELELPMEQSQSFNNGYAAAAEYCE